MSLIDEALKRARDQQLPAATAPDGSKSGRPADPWAYAPLPHARRRSGARPWAIAAGVAVIAAAAAAMWMSRSGRPPVPTVKGNTTIAAPRVAAVEPPSVPSAALPAISAPRAVEPPKPAAAAARKLPDETRLKPERKAAPAPAPERAAPGGPVSTTVLNPPGETSAREAAKPEPPPQLPRPANRAVDGRTYVGALVAPSGARVELGGIVYSETNASALLNGRILPVGAVVEGMTISAIHEDRVDLSAEGLIVHLTLR